MICYQYNTTGQIKQFKQLREESRDRQTDALKYIFIIFLLQHFSWSNVRIPIKWILKFSFKFLDDFDLGEIKAQVGTWGSNCSSQRVQILVWKGGCETVKFCRFVLKPKGGKIHLFQTKVGNGNIYIHIFVKVFFVFTFESQWILCGMGIIDINMFQTIRLLLNFARHTGY